jgi:hypothetical protein
MVPMADLIARIRRRALLALGALLAVSTLAACGGSGAGAGGAGTVAASGSETGTVRVLADTTTLSSDGKTPVNLTAIVTAGSNVAVKGASVDFRVSDDEGPGQVSVQVVKAVTDETGAATAKLSLLGSARARTLKVVATSFGIESAPLAISVAGTTLSVSGPSSLALSGAAASNFTVVVKDSGGKPLSNQQVTASSDAGNSVSPASAFTDASGQALFGVTGTRAGADTLSFSALGVTERKSITVASQGLAITGGAGFGEVAGTKAVAVGGTATVQVAYQASGPMPANAEVELSTTKGTVTPARQSIATGTASFTVTSTSPGPATLTAVVNGVTAEYAFNFVAVLPQQVLLSVSQSTLGPNVAGTSEQRATLTATVLDANGFPVPNRLVAFNAVDDPSGGSIVPGVATTDLAGRATAAFVAGPNATAPNAVRIRASTGSLVSPETLISVSRTQLFVRLGTDNLVEKIDPALYRKTYAVVVTDATGNAVRDATVQATLRPLRYRTGVWFWDTDSWTQIWSGTFDSEDTDRNGVCSAGEDANGDGQLTPGNVATVEAQSVTTENGTGAVRLQYPREFAQWVDVLLEVRIQVAGSEGVASAQFFLPIAASDLTDKNVAPPGATSPFPYPSGPAISRSCP